MKIPVKIKLQELELWVKISESNFYMKTPYTRKVKLNKICLLNKICCYLIKSFDLRPLEYLRFEWEIDQFNEDVTLEKFLRTIYEEKYRKQDEYSWQNRQKGQDSNQGLAFRPGRPEPDFRTAGVGIGLDVIGTVEIGLRLLGLGFSGQPDFSPIFGKLFSTVHNEVLKSKIGQVVILSECKIWFSAILTTTFWKKSKSTDLIFSL